MKYDEIIQLSIDIDNAVKNGTYKPSILTKHLCEILQYDEVEFLRKKFDFLNGETVL